VNGRAAFGCGGDACVEPDPTRLGETPAAGPGQPGRKTDGEPSDSGIAAAGLTRSIGTCAIETVPAPPNSARTKARIVFVDFVVI
jgi:hypothetical protein